jgi:uncharacterized membrane protein
MSADQRTWKSLSWLLFAGYALLLFCLVPIRPLWLDELMEVVASAGLPLRQVVAGYAAHSAGQSPLAAAEQALAIDLLGFSTFAARLPAALASLLGCVGMIVLGKRIRFGLLSWLSFALLASFPLALRYGSEDRPYSQALCVAIWLTVCFLELLHAPVARLYVTYAAVLTIGLYTQPYVLFVAVSHASFLLARRNWRLLFSLLSVLCVSALAYLPWYLHSRAFWRQEIEASQLHFHLQPKLLLLIPRELTGAGYAGTAALVLLSFYGIPWLPKGERSLWALLIVLPVCLVVLADLAFDYFFAIRQIIFVLPPLAITSAAGVVRLWQTKGRRAALAVASLLFLLNIGYAIRWFTKPGEDWAAAARTLSNQISSGACFIALPSSSGAYYEFFQPELVSHECNPTLLKVTRVALAISPYLIDHDAEPTLQARLQTAGFVLANRQERRRPEIQLYVRH